MLPPRPGVTKANFHRIENGMDKTEIEGILGGSTENHWKIGGVLLCTWSSPDGKVAVAIIFDDDMKVVNKGWEGPPDLGLPLIRPWLGLP